MMSAHIFMLSVTNTHSTPQRSEHKHEMICRRLTPNSQSLFYQFAVWMAWNWNHVRLSRWIIEKKKCSKHRMWINQRNSDRDFDRSERKKRVGMLIRIRNSKTDIWWFLISESQIRVASFAFWLRSWNIHSCIQYVCVNDRRVENDWLWYFFSSIHTHISCSDGVLVNQNIYMQKGAWYNLSDDRHVACAHPSQCCMTHVRRNTNTTHKKWTIIGNNNNNNR